MTKELIIEWLDTLFDADQTGYIYTPYKTATGAWVEKYWAWPSTKQNAASYIHAKSKENDCYVSPSLFDKRSANQENWKGTNYVWCEFDGNAPKELPASVPEPTLRVRSSTSGHEHWYWRLESFSTSGEVVENLNRRLAYTLDADKSGWDRNQVLRPLGTVHHDSGLKVQKTHASATRFSAENFRDLIVAPSVAQLQAERLPDVRNVAARYTWPSESLELFERTEQQEGSRSSALTALGFACVEMGMTNDECLTILYDADDRWKKFTARTPESRLKALTSIITYCRSKKVVQAELQIEERETFISWGDFNALDIKVDWCYEQLIPEQGLGILSGLPGVGKSTLGLTMGFQSILGRNFLAWKNPGKTRRVGFISLEMASYELKTFLDVMGKGYDLESKKQLYSEFFMLPIGYSLMLGDKNAQKILVEEIKKHKIVEIYIDSLKAATRLDEKIMDNFFLWVNKVLRGELGITVWLIHHNRKPSAENKSKAPTDVSDLYGDVFIAAHATSVLAFHEQAGGLKVIPLKIRLAQKLEAFRIKRGPHLSFSIDNAEQPDADDEPKEGKFA